MNNVRLVHWHLKMTSQIPGWQSQSVQFCSDAQSCPTLCNPKNRSTSGLPVHHQLPEFTQTHVHRVGDATNHLILCHPLLLPPSIFPSIRVFYSESVLRIRWPKYWIQDCFPLGWTRWISLQSKGLSRVFSNKGPSSQGYGFSSSHVWMRELDHKESWVLKN